MSNQKSNITFESAVNQIESIKKEWLDKKIELIYLSPKINELLEKIEDVDVKKNLKSYVDNKILLDSNVENSNNVVANISSACVSAIITLLLSSIIIETESIEIVVLFVLMLMGIGMIIIYFPIVRKHCGKYAREKSFYEIVLKGL